MKPNQYICIIIFILNFQLSAQPPYSLSHSLDNQLNNNYSKTQTINKINFSMKDFILSDIDKYKLTFLNNFLFLIPPLAWNLAYGANNPAQLGYFDGEVPNSLLVAENIFRISAMMYPVFLPINTNHKLFNPGLITYLSGLAIYFSSWAYLMGYPESNISETAIMRFAPAYTPIIWLTGISLMSRSKIQFVLSTTFIAMHVIEYVFRY